MSYEIPQQLEYKEKIMFGLNFRQLFFAFLFLPLSAIIFFRSDMPLFFRIFLSMNLSALAVGFMFFDLDKHIRIWYKWFRTRKIEKPEKLEKFVPIKEIKNNLIHTKDKRKLAVLEVEPINFSIKPNNAKESITLIFQKFLNGIDFPVQILMNTESLNLKDYFEEIETKIRKAKLYQNLFEKYKEHLESVGSKKDVLNRKFYLVIPEKNDINVQLQICENKLDSLGLQNRRLDDRKLKELISKFFEGGKNFIPKRIENNPSYIKIGNTLSRTIYAHGYPRSVESGFLDKVVSSLGDFDLSVHVEPLVQHPELGESMRIFYNAVKEKS